MVDVKNRPFEQNVLREMAVWSCAGLAAYVMFSSFEGLYDAAQAAATRAGYAHLVPAGTGSAAAGTMPLSVGNLRGTIRPTPLAKKVGSLKRVELAANVYGHFHADADIDGQIVEFMTDTGATYVALNYETAQRLGLAPNTLQYSGRSTTANGVARVASVTLNALKVGGITVRNVQAVVAEPGRMTQNLLGMSFIRRLSGFELSGSKLVMTE